MGLRTRERSLTLIAAICVGVLVGDKLVYSPLKSMWTQRAERIAELEKNLNRGRTLVEREDALRASWEAMKDRALSIDASAAEETMFQAMDQWVRSSRLGVTSFKPSWRQDEDGTFKTIECRADANGDIAALSRFLYELECNPLPLHIEDMTISARDESGRTLTLKIRFSGLVLAEVK